MGPVGQGSDRLSGADLTGLRLRLTGPVSPSDRDVLGLTAVGIAVTSASALDRPSGDEDIEVDRTGQGKRGDGGQHGDHRASEPEPGGRGGFLVEPDRVQRVGPDAGCGGCTEQRPDIEPGSQGRVPQDQQGAHPVGDESVDHQREEVGEETADVDGDGHLLEGVVREGASRAAEGDDDRAIPAGDVRRGRRCRDAHAAVPKSSRPRCSPVPSGGAVVFAAC